MKHYYLNSGNLYSCDTPINGENFSEISSEEYSEKLLLLKEKREEGTLVETTENWESENFATDSDYLYALKSLGVEFGG